MPPIREWDGASYDRVSGPMEALGRDVLERLELVGDETVLDAGCGSGRITEALIERLPRGRAIAVDQSPSMVEAAKQRLGPDADVRVVDLLELDLDEPVDAVLSTATFHWIADHDLLFKRLRSALRPAGRLVAQCGERATSPSCAARSYLCSPKSPIPSISAIGARLGTTRERR